MSEALGFAFFIHTQIAARNHTVEWPVRGCGYRGGRIEASSDIRNCWRARRSGEDGARARLAAGTERGRDLHHAEQHDTEFDNDGHGPWRSKDHHRRMANWRGGIQMLELGPLVCGQFNK
jgi:hypothetical protein